MALAYQAIPTFWIEHDKTKTSPGRSSGRLPQHPVPDLGSPLASGSVLEEFSLAQNLGRSAHRQLSSPVGVYPLPIDKFLTLPPWPTFSNSPLTMVYQKFLSSNPLSAMADMPTLCSLLS